MTLLTIEDVAAFLQMSPKAVYRRVERCQLPCVRIGRRLFFDPKKLQKHLGLTDTPTARTMSALIPAHGEDP